MKVKETSCTEIHVNDNDSYIFVSTDGKCFINGKFFDILSMVLGVIHELYEDGNSFNKKFLESDFVETIVELSKKTVMILLT